MCLGISTARYNGSGSGRRRWLYATEQGREVNLRLV